MTWPVSEQMEASGYTDTFRTLNSNLLQFENTNWSGGAEEKSWRIDYIYTKGRTLKAKRSTM